MTYRFREIEKPRFSLQSGFLSAMLFLMLFFFLLDQSKILQVQLTPEEIQKIKESQDELERDLLFRFIESPEDDIIPKKDTAYSDLDRKAKSMTNEELEPENEDPFSRGESFELKQRNEPEPEDSPQPAKPLSLDQIPTPAAPPTMPEEPEPVEEDKEKKDLPELDTERETEKFGKIPTWTGAPKPYRPPSKEELKQANEAAKQALAKESRFKQQNQARESEQYDNLEGRATPSIGFSIDTAGHDLGPYLKLFIQLVKGNWRIPNIARLEASGVTGIEFKLHKDGSITEAHVLSESGFEALDSSSLNAILNTHPAPPLPAHIEEEWIPIKFGFYYNVRPPR